MECLACTACVDACDDMMDKVHKPRGLIRFASQRELARTERKTLRPRVVVYGLLMLVSAVAFTASVVLRAPFEANVIRPRGALPYFVDGDNVRNAFEVHLFNKQPETASFTLSVRAPDGAQVVVGTPTLQLASLTDARVPVSVSLPRGVKPELVLEVRDDNSGVVREVPMRFLTP
jgi:polyferredoxin